MEPPEQLEPVKELLDRHKQPGILWHHVLNRHRVTECKTFTVQPEGPTPGSASVVKCTLRLPNSFAPGDGLEVLTHGSATSAPAASEDACHAAIATLLCRGASKIVLTPWHWKIPIDVLIAEVDAILHAQNQALPVHERRGQGGAKAMP